jgi:hypothetical protein
MKWSHLLASVGTVALALPGAASAASLGVDFLPGAIGGTSPGTGHTFGYKFTDVTTADVVGLGAWDSGLTGSVEVGLWDSSGALLASTAVNSAGTPVGNAPWVFSSIAPVKLTAGDTYYVGAVAPNAFAVNPISVDPHISNIVPVYYTSSNGLHFPAFTYTSVEYAYFGGNIELSATVPEPATWAMLGIGFAALGGAAVRRRRRQTAAA